VAPKFRIGALSGEPSSPKKESVTVATLDELRFIKVNVVCQLPP